MHIGGLKQRSSWLREEQQAQKSGLQACIGIPMETIRNFRPGDEAALFQVFFSAVHGLACRDYTPAQTQAWAPADMDQDLWAQRMQTLKPFVAERGGEIAGYADLQAQGYVDHFYVSVQHPRQGIGTRLMLHILAQADSRGLAELTAEVSVTAEPFFALHGFQVLERRWPVRRGVVLANALMRRCHHVSCT